MRLREAQEIGAAKLNIDAALFSRSVEQARRMRVEEDHLGPMALALAFMVASGVRTGGSEGEQEMRDALRVISQAEDEWRMERKISRKARLS